MAVAEDFTETHRQLNALGQVAAGVGHHVINAFSAIVSNAEILRLTTSMPDAADPAAVADLIVRTAVDASGVARRLIDLSRPATAHGEGTADMAALAAALVESRRRDAPAGVGYATSLAPVPLIKGHPAQLHSMLDHLATNAEEALRPGGGTILVSTAVDERGWVVVEVRDDGAGMTPEVQERAVEPFYTTKGGHLGIGLTVANGIWRRHRGTLSARGAPGEGTLIRLCVEAAKPAPG